MNAFPFREYAVVVPVRFTPDLQAVYARAYRAERDRLFQAFHNSLYDNHPDDLSRWADDGGRAP